METYEPIRAKAMSMSDAEFIQSLSERELTELIVIPLLQAMGFSNIRHTHGPHELGKDLVFCREDPLAGTRHYAMTIKRAKLTGKVSSSRSLISVYFQLRQALDEPLFDVSSHTRLKVDCVYLLTPHVISESSLASIRAQLEHDTSRVRIVDGPMLLKLIVKHNPALLQPIQKTLEGGAEQIAVEKLVAKPALSRVLADFETLLAQEPEESRVQTFLEDNGVLFQRFAPQTILKKAPILNKYQTDFAIMSETSELILVEIEKPSVRLLRKDGGRSAGLNHAFDQVNDWLDILRNHRAACIQSMGLSEGNVSAVRGVVVMGRDAQCPKADLRKLKSTNFGDVAFFTYDDLLGSLRALIRALDGL